MKKIFNILNSKRSFSLLAIIIAVVFFFIGQNSANTGIVLPYFAFNENQIWGNGTGNYTCQGKVTMDVQANGKAFGSNKAGIDTGVSSNDNKLDKINMQIGGTPYGTSLKFDVNTDANAPDYTITENDNNILSAYYLSKGTYGEIKKNITSISIFTLNKKTGIAIWTYLSPQYLFSSNPGGQIENLLCN